MDAARALFAEQGFEETTTRDLARAAGVATGTLFNYFPTKEALGLALLSQDLQAAEAEFLETRRPQESLEERLFALNAVALRHLLPARGWVSAALAQALSPLRTVAPSSAVEAIRTSHLERVSSALRELGGLDDEASESSQLLHLYWSLHLGVLGFWTRDETHNQEATLAFLDRSVRLFCRALREDSDHESAH